jgi:hypothetical protein
LLRAAQQDVSLAKTELDFWILPILLLRGLEIGEREIVGADLEIEIAAADQGRDMGRVFLKGFIKVGFGGFGIFESGEGPTAAGVDDGQEDLNLEGLSSLLEDADELIIGRERLLIVLRFERFLAFLKHPLDIFLRERLLLASFAFDWRRGRGIGERVLGERRVGHQPGHERQRGEREQLNSESTGSTHRVNLGGGRETVAANRQQGTRPAEATSPQRPRIHAKL